MDVTTTQKTVIFSNILNSFFHPTFQDFISYSDECQAKKLFNMPKHVATFSGCSKG